MNKNVYVLEILFHQTFPMSPYIHMGKFPSVLINQGHNHFLCIYIFLYLENDILILSMT